MLCRGFSMNVKRREGSTMFVHSCPSGFRSFYPCGFYKVDDLICVICVGCDVYVASPAYVTPPNTADQKRTVSIKKLHHLQGFSSHFYEAFLPVFAFVFF